MIRNGTSYTSPSLDSSNLIVTIASAVSRLSACELTALRAHLPSISLVTSERPTPSSKVSTACSSSTATCCSTPPTQSPCSAAPSRSSPAAYAAKKLGNGQLNVDFEDGLDSVRFGDWAPNPYPVRSVGAGFLRIKTAALKHIAKELKLPWCRIAERFAWPFFQPMVIEQDGGNFYLGEDYSFIHRCRMAGLTPKVDTSFRLYHIGDYAYGLEEAAGQYLERSRNIDYRIKRAAPRSRPRLCRQPGLGTCRNRSN